MVPRVGTLMGLIEALVGGVERRGAIGTVRGAAWGWGVGRICRVILGIDRILSKYDRVRVLHEHWVGILLWGWVDHLHLRGVVNGD